MNSEYVAKKQQSKHVLYHIFLKGKAQIKQIEGREM